MSGLDDEIRRALEEVRGVRLDAVGWAEIERELVDLRRAVDGQDEVAARASVIRLHQAAFEGKVRGRLAGGDQRTASPVVLPTKSTSALPLVGLVCAVVLLLIGGALGGTAVLVGTAVFAVFILVVAMAGSRVTHQRLDRTGRAPTAEVPEVAPPNVDGVIRSLEGRLGE